MKVTLMGARYELRLARLGIGLGVIGLFVIVLYCSILIASHRQYVSIDALEQSGGLGIVEGRVAKSSKDWRRPDPDSDADHVFGVIGLGDRWYLFVDRSGKKAVVRVCDRLAEPSVGTEIRTRGDLDTGSVFGNTRFTFATPMIKEDGRWEKTSEGWKRIQ